MFHIISSGFLSLSGSLLALERKMDSFTIYPHELSPRAFPQKILSNVTLFSVSVFILRLKESGKNCF